MAYATDTVRLSVYGTIDGVQSWSTGFALAVELAPGSWGPNNLQSLVSALNTGPLTTWWTALTLIPGTTTLWTGTRAYYYPAGATSSAFLADVPLTTAKAGTGAGSMPRLISICASLRTDVAGRSGRGRSYFPCTGVSTPTTGQFASTTCTTVANAYAALLTSFNGFNVAPYNLTGMTSVVASLTKSQNNDITSVIVDSIPDTQHRREDKLSPGSIAHAVV